jgi:hypothetical protein
VAARIPAIEGNSATTAVALSNSPGAGKAQSTSFLDMLAKATDNAQPSSALPLVVEPRPKETTPTKAGNGYRGSAKSGSATQPAASPLSFTSAQLPQLSAQDLSVAAMPMRSVTTPTVVTTGASDSAADSASDSPSDSSFPDSVKLGQVLEVNAGKMATFVPSFAAPSVFAGGVRQLSGSKANSDDHYIHSASADTETGTSVGTALEATSAAKDGTFTVPKEETTAGTTTSATPTDANVTTDAATTEDATTTKGVSNTTGVIADIIHAANAEIELSVPISATHGGSAGLIEDTKSAGQDVAKTTASVPPSPMGSRSVPTASEIAKPKQELPSAGEEVPRTSADASPSRTIDRDLSSTSDAHKPAKQSTDIAADAVRPQPTPLSVEITKSGTPSTIAAGPQSVESHGGSQSSGDDKSDHGAKHEGSASPAGLGPESKDLQSAGSPLVFGDAISAQSLDGSALKGTVSVATPLNQTAPSQANESVQSGLPHNSDRIEQQQQSLEALISPFQSAKLTDRGGQSELHVGFQAGEFGNVDIRTSILRNQVTAEISVERGDLHNMLAVDLPHLKEKLASHSVAEANIVLNNQSGGSSSDSRQAYRRFTEASQSSASHAVEVDSLPEIAGITESQTPSSQLDVRM